MRSDRSALRTGWGTLVTLALTLLSSGVLAQAERAQSFQAVEGAVAEDIAGGPLMLGAYAIIWTLLLLYVVRLARLQQRTQADVQRLESLLAKSAPERG